MSEHVWVWVPTASSSLSLGATLDGISYAGFGMDTGASISWHSERDLGVRSGDRTFVQSVQDAIALRSNRTTLIAGAEEVHLSADAGVTLLALSRKLDAALVAQPHDRPEWPPAGDTDYADGAQQAGIFWSAFDSFAALALTVADGVMAYDSDPPSGRSKVAAWCKNMRAGALGDAANLAGFAMNAWGWAPEGGAAPGITAYAQGSILISSTATTSLYGAAGLLVSSATFTSVWGANGAAVVGGLSAGLTAAGSVSATAISVTAGAMGKATFSGGAHLAIGESSVPAAIMVGAPKDPKGRSLAHQCARVSFSSATVSLDALRVSGRSLVRTRAQASLHSIAAKSSVSLRGIEHAVQLRPDALELGRASPVAAPPPGGAPPSAPPPHAPWLRMAHGEILLATGPDVHLKVNSRCVEAAAGPAKLKQFALIDGLGVKLEASGAAPTWRPVAEDIG